VYNLEAEHHFCGWCQVRLPRSLPRPPAHSLTPAL
jgi:hypothetical protein